MSNLWRKISFGSGRMDLLICMLICALMALILVLVWAYLSYRRLYSAVFRFLLAVLILLVACQAQDASPQISAVGGPHPVVFDPDRIQQAATMIGSWAAEWLAGADHERFLADDYWPNSLNNSTVIA